MNANTFLSAMGDINDGYILSAQRRLGYLAAAKKPRSRALRRTFTVALAAVLAVLCTLAAAMAVSPELREAIISLFQIGEVEQVPGVPEAAYQVKQITIGGEVSAQYVKLDVDKDQAFEGGQQQFYDVIDGVLTEVGADPSELSTMLSWYGRDIDIHLRFFVYDGLLYLCDGSGGGCEEEAMTFVVMAERLGTRTDVVLLRGECYGSEVDTNWAWVCDLKTGQVWDLLAGCGIGNPDFVQPVLIAEDLKHALVRAWDGVPDSGYTPYLADLEAKTCTPLSQLMDLDIPTSFGSYEVTFSESDTVLLAMYPLWRPEPTSVWAYHIPSGAVTPTAVEESELTSIETVVPYDWELAQMVDEDGAVTLLNLRTGSRTRLEGITAQGSCWLKANPSRTKLLWVDWGDSGLKRLGVIDLESGEFTAFQRESMELRYNESVFWLNDNRVAAKMDLHTGQPYDSYPTSEYYLCVYEF